MKPQHNIKGANMPETSSPLFTLISKPGCVQCNATIRHFPRKGLEAGRDFVIIDVTQDAQALKHVQDLNYAQVPVVLTTDEHWSGYRPDKINHHLPSLQPAEKAILGAQEVDC